MQAKPEIKNPVIKSVGAVLALGLVGYMGFADSKADLLGDLPLKRDSREKAAMFLLNWSSQSRYELQYLGATVAPRDDGSGVLGLFHYPPEKIGSDCLVKTPYDTTIHPIRNWLGDVVNYSDPQSYVAFDASDDHVSVRPYGGLSPLNFAINASGVLQPTDIQTLKVLEGHGCDTEHLSGSLTVYSD